MNKPEKNNNPWKTLSSKLALDTPWLKVREDKVITPGGEEGQYYVIESKPGVLVIAETNQKEIYLIENFRYQLREWRWEIPGGGIDDGDTPLEAAQKELKEELGFTADKWTQLGDMFPSNNGPMNDHNLVFLAQDLQPATKKHESGEAIKPPEAIPRDKVFEMITKGELTDGQSLGVLLFYKLWIDNN